MATAATFISNSIGTVSSLDTGRVGYFVAWGGSEDGYAYTYTLSAPPAGVTIDSDTGILSIGTALAAGSYNFTVTAKNRENTALTTGFAYTLVVLQGVTSGRTGTQILNKTYDPFSGTWGAPSGNDWTAVFQSMAAAIISDQTTAGSENLHATIIFRHAVTYQYTDPRWLTGIQYFQCIEDPAHLTGALPILQNVSSDTAYLGGPLNIGAAGAMDHQGGIKALCARLQVVAIGDSVVSLQSSGDASKIKVGRWHRIIGQCQQVGGYPANAMWNDYVKVTAVNGSAITLDRKVKFRYSDTWWENFSDDDSFGRAWLVPLDTGGTGGAVPADPRIGLRCLFKNINFARNTNSDGVMLTSGYLDLTFDGCTMQGWQATMGKHYMAVGCTFQAQPLPVDNGLAFEPDKLSETLILDNCTTDECGGATGFLYFLARNTNATCWQIMPRQLRTIGCNFTPGNNSRLKLPITFASNGSMMYADIESTVFGPNTFDSSANTWTFQGNPGTPIIVGTDATWSGNQLQIPRGFAGFEDWLDSTYEGAIISTTGIGPITANWGYVNTMSSDGASNGALWLNIVWVNGTKPLSGNIYNRQGRRLTFASTNSFTAPMAWADPKFMKETTTPFRANYDYPTGAPAVVTTYPGAFGGGGGTTVSLAGRVKSISQAFAQLTVSGSPNINLAGRTKALSAATGALTLTAPAAPTTTFTMVSVTGTCVVTPQ